METELYNYELINKKTNSNNKSKTKLDECIDIIIKKEGYISWDVMIQKVDTDGGNYLGHLYGINIKGKTADGPKETPIFIKAMAPDAIDLELLSLNDVYNKELFAYKELFKVFSELQDQADVPTDERYKVAKSYDESDSKMIVLEDLTKSGFRTWHRMDCVTIDMAEACIKQLAKFHGLSFIIQDKRPEYFEDKIKPLEQPFIFGTKTWDNFCRNFTKTSLDHLDEETRRKVEDKIPGILLKYPEYMQDKKSQRCLCHGDFRPNNIMIKEKNGKIIDAMAVDFQLIHFGCPILDFYFFLYTGADFEFRRNHITHLKDLYFETLVTFLKHFNVSLNSVYSKDKFEEEIVEKRVYGLMVSVLYLSFMFASEGNIPDLSKEAVSELNILLDERFKGRIIGVIQEFIELNIL